MTYSTLDNRKIRLLVVASGNDFEADIQCQLVVKELPDIKPSDMPDDKPKDKTDDKPNRKTDERPNEKPDAKPNNKSRLKKPVYQALFYVLGRSESQGGTNRRWRNPNPRNR